MPGPNWHNDISRSELPHGWIALTGGISDKAAHTIEQLAKTFDEKHVAGVNNVATTSTSNKASFAGSTFNTDSTGTADAKELFNGWVGKTKDNYDN